MSNREQTNAQVRRASVRAKVRRAIRTVLAQSEHLALDNARDRAQLERALLQELVP